MKPPNPNTRSPRKVALYLMLAFLFVLAVFLAQLLR